MVITSRIPFCCFEKFLAYTLFLPSFIVVKRQMAELDGEGGLYAPHYYRVVLDPNQNRVKISYLENLLCIHSLNNYLQIAKRNYFISSAFFSWTNSESINFVIFLPPILDFGFYQRKSKNQIG